MKKLMLGIAAGICLLSACKGKIETTTTSGDSTANILKKNVQTAMSIEDAMNKKDVAGMFKDCAPGYVDYGSGEGKPMKNIDSLKINMKSFFAAFPDLKGERLMPVAQDSTVIVTGDWTGTFKAEFMNIKPTGKSYKVADADIFTFNKDGKVTSHKSIQSEVTYFYQLGIAMPGKK